MSEEPKDKGKGDLAPSLAVLGCLATGFLACVGGVAGFADNQISGAALCFFVAAFAFGIVVYVSFSD